MKDKDYYIDFENGCFTPAFKLEIEYMIESINNGSIDLKDFIWCESLKDELRNASKQGVPRSFRISRIHIQVLTKMCFGNMIAQLIETRNFHGIMVGLNPFKEWPDIYNKFKKCDLIWDLDFKNWDGKMLPQVQTCLNEVMIEKYEGKYPVVAEFLLTTLLYTPISINDDVFISTHSMPSGSFLTAYYNSLINKGLKAMWAYRNNIKTVSDFFNNIEDIVYGDDTLTGVKKLNEQTKNLNAITMANFIESVGMECTDANKNKITKPSTPIEDITFLKRNFKYHSKIKQIVCPLDVNTLMSGLSYYNKEKVAQDVLQDKIHCFQREMFLHENLYEYCVDKLSQECKNKNIYFNKLPEQYLISLYKEEPDKFLEMSWGGSKYL